MKKKNKFDFRKKGFTLIETITVVGILSIFVILGVVSYRDSKNTIVLNMTSELINNDILEMSNEILTEKLKSSTFIFSLAHPQLYYHEDIFNLSENKRNQMAKNFQVSTLTPPSQIESGAINFTWEKNHSNDIVFQAISKKSVFSEEIGDITTVSSDITPLNNSQKYDFILTDTGNLLISNRIRLYYFSSVNYENNKDSSRTILLAKIEGQNFAGEWKPLNSLSIKIYEPFIKRKYISLGTEYQKAKFTFKIGSDEITFTL